MTLESRDVCNVPNVCWQRVPDSRYVRPTRYLSL